MKNILHHVAGHPSISRGIVFSIWTMRCGKTAQVFEIQADGSWVSVDNPLYDPEARPDPRPEECKGSVCSQCIGCLYFVWCDAGEDENR